MATMTRVTAVSTTSSGVAVAAIAPATISHAASALPMSALPAGNRQHDLCQGGRPDENVVISAARADGRPDG
jgi:antitoxin (DNA-binding transcriptional repressor) of toxin-antitoxin stability system